jgi:alanine racemase
MSILIKNIVPILKARTVGNTEEAVVDTVSIDSRSLQNSVNTLFFALVGPNNDAHTYIKDLIATENFVVLHIQKDVQIRLIFSLSKILWTHCSNLRLTIAVVFIFPLV